MAKPKEIKPISQGTLYISMLLSAEPGWGKTVFGGSSNRSLILSFDPEGVDSAWVQGSKADVWEIRTFAQLDKAYRYLRDEGHTEYDWVIIDSITEVQKMFQAEWLDANRDKAGKRHPDVLGIDGYQVTQNQVYKFVKQFNDLPMHKLYTAGIQTLEDDDGELFYLPLIHGGRGDVARTVSGYMKVTGFGVWHGEDEDNLTRRIYFQNSGAYRGKDRFDALGRFQDEVTLPKLEELVRKRAEKRKASGAKKTSKVNTTTKTPARTRARRSTAAQRAANSKE